MSVMQVASAVSSERSFVPASTPAVTVAAPADTLEQAAAGPAEGAASMPGVRVSLSADGLARSKQRDDKNADIEQSNLPDDVKQLLKMIRELKAQLAQKMAELQALMAQGNTDDQAHQARLRALQTEVGSLGGALNTANAQLVKVMRDLSNEQSAVVGSLMVK